MSKEVGKTDEQDLTEKLRTKIPTSYRIPKGYFQQERFQKVENSFIQSLFGLTPRKTNHSNGSTVGKSLHNDGVQWNMNKLKFSFLGKTTQ